MRRVGGARRGLDLWLVQRVSAVYMALFLPAFWFCRAGTGYAGWHAQFLGLPMKAAALLFVAALLLHAASSAASDWAQAESRGRLPLAEDQ